MTTERYSGYKLFVIVDAFLDRSQQAVQALHAAVKFCLDHPDVAKNKWGNQNVVIKKAKDFERWASESDAIFVEPYWDNKQTACVAFRPEGYAEELPLI